MIRDDIRPFVESDREFVIALTKEKYPTRDISKGIPWVEWCLTQPDRLVLVGPNSFGVAGALWHYGFERRGSLAILCSRPRPGAAFEVLRMVRTMIRWAKERGCSGAFKMESDPETDFGPLVRRLGGQSRTFYELPLE